jgi:hypothetical protein
MEIQMRSMEETFWQAPACVKSCQNKENDGKSLGHDAACLTRIVLYISP